VTAAMTPASAARPVTVMPLGASITYGYGSADGNGYRAALRDHLVHDLGMNVDFVGSVHSGTMADNQHEGHPGWRIDQIAAKADRWMAVYRPRIVIMHLGTNDMIQNYRSATAPDRLVGLAEHIVAISPGTTVYISSLVASTDPPTNERINAFNNRLPLLMAQPHPGVIYVDQHAVMPMADLSDKVHPTSAGYRLIADAWYQSIKHTAPEH
jgi:lysophospholipase L1-like esterase